MDHLEQQAAAVEAVFSELDAAIRQFQEHTTLHCKWGCGKCCFKPDIEATILEFLPFALHAYHQGLAESWHTRLLAEASPTCMILNPTSTAAGLCSQYAHRGLICRLFGYSARTNKYNQKELVTCQVIKTDQANAYANSQAAIANGLPVPVMSHYYFQLQSIDPDLGRSFYPINQALRLALEKVMHHYTYR
ncbi:MAG: YkgJ family cysteine cluster protein [Cyclobacteriaceae bacterium]|jgi:Fe-S-cluster containining protein|nr:YkgJ family cysteine cluster protein [Cyclobacteriaceae bacterium]